MRFSILPLVTLAVAASSELYLSTSSSTGSIELNGIEAKSILSHLLDTARFEQLPLPTDGGADHWREALEGSDWRGLGNKLIVILESDNSADVLPVQFMDTKPYSVVSLPTVSWTSLLALNLHRLGQELNISNDRIHGLSDIIHSLKSLSGWKNLVGEELGARIGWEQAPADYKITQIKQRPSIAHLVTDLDLLDSSATLFVDEIQSLFELVDSLHQATSSGSDNAPQGHASKKIAAIHLSGLKAIEAVHTRSSKQYKSAAALLKSTLSATFASVLADSPQSTLIFLSVPTYTPPVFRKRNFWLKPFYESHHDLSSIAPTTQKLSKRNANNYVRAVAPAYTPTPIVPSSSTCFESLDSLNNATNSCNAGNGYGVKGVSAIMGKHRESCWVCHCGSTMDGARKTNWKGQGCEKIDLSSEFTLVFFSGLFLLVILFASVSMLYGVGNVELPGTLASVNGSGPGGKRA